MKNSELKKMLVKEAKVAVPDIKVDLKMMLDQFYAPVKELEITKAKHPRLNRTIATLGFTLALAIFLLLPSLNLNSANSLNVDSPTYVSIDINPSIELVVNNQNKVESCRAMNKDAELMLFDLDLTDYTLEDATSKIMDLAIELGYIDKSASNNAVMITAVNENETSEKTITNTILAKLSDFFAKRSLDGKVNVITTNDDSYKEQASKVGLTIGKYILITKAMEADKSLTFEEAKKMSVKDLVEKMTKYNQSEIDNFRNDLIKKFQEQSVQYKVTIIKKQTDLIQLNQFIEDLMLLKVDKNQQVKYKVVKNRIDRIIEPYSYKLQTELSDKYSSQVVDDLIKELRNLSDKAVKELIDLQLEYEQIRQNFIKEQKSLFGMNQLTDYPFLFDLEFMNYWFNMSASDYIDLNIYYQ
jgi:hypothetical protein